MGSNAQRRRAQRDSKVARMRQDEQARQRRSTTLLTVALVVAVVGAVAGIWWAVAAGNAGDTSPGAITGVTTYDTLSRDHTTKAVDYPQTPPVGGAHDPQWLDCTGTVYDEPVEDEAAVHALEHGAVWVSYDPSLPASDVDQLKGYIDGSYIFMSPVVGQASAVMATAWGNQLQLDGVSDPRLDEFITEFRQGPQTPEPGASCDAPTTMPSG